MVVTYNRTIHQSAVQRHSRAGSIAVGSVAAGIILAIVWSYTFVDSVIGDSIANSVLGKDAKESAITTVGAGLALAFVSGLAGTFTACNVAMIAAVGPVSESGVASSATRGTSRLLRVLVRPIGWLTAGMVIVSGTYGFIGVLLSDSLPQLSTSTMPSGMPIRLVQAMVIFGIIGAVLTWMGLAALGLVRDVFAGRPTLRVFVLGTLIGGFVIGRPFPLFNKMFHWAAAEGNPLLGAGAFVLQSLGNIAIISVLYILLVLLTKGGFLRWLAGDHQRLMAITGALLVTLGIFSIIYWDVRVPAMFGIGWFPTMPYK